MRDTHATDSMGTICRETRIAYARALFRSSTYLDVVLADERAVAVRLCALGEERAVVHSGVDVEVVVAC